MLIQGSWTYGKIEHLRRVDIRECELYGYLYFHLQCLVLTSA